MDQPKMPKYVIEITSLHGLQFKIPLGNEADLIIAEQAIEYALSQVRKELGITEWRSGTISADTVEELAKKNVG